jgi:D-alanyl-D-alanine carboxypeptidase (penicillin-binding protein 5/6)
VTENLKSLYKILHRNRGLLLVIFLSLFFCWRISVIQAELATIHNQLAADLQRQTELLKELEQLKPHRKKGQQEPELTARSAVSVLINQQGKERILFEKNIDEILPIASISKLMTAYVSLNHYDPSYRINELVHLILIESNNWAAQDLAQIMGQEEFVVLMNSIAQDIELSNTYFINSTGLDGEEDFNYSTVRDLVKFARHIFEQEPIIWRISLLQEYRNSLNTNKLLSQVSGIIGGKTGGTVKAGECFLLLVEAPNDRGYVINIILGSADRFGEMEELLDWVYDSYIW